MWYIFLFLIIFFLGKYLIIIRKAVGRKITNLNFFFKKENNEWKSMGRTTMVSYTRFFFYKFKCNDDEKSLFVFVQPS